MIRTIFCQVVFYSNSNWTTNFENFLRATVKESLIIIIFIIYLIKLIKSEITKVVLTQIHNFVSGEHGKGVENIAQCVV